MDTAEQHFARRLFNIVSDQPDDDVEQLRKLATDARRMGYVELANTADFIADCFEGSESEKTEK